MAITVQAGAGAAANSPATTITPALPASVISGDLLLVLVCFQATGATCSASGYTSIHDFTSATAGDRFHVLKKTAGSSEAAPVVTITSGSCVAMVIRVRGWDPAGGPAQLTTQTSSTTTASIDPPTAGSVKIAVAHNDPTTAGSVSWGSGATSLGDIANVATSYISAAYKLEDTAGAITFTWSGAGPMEALILSVAPSAAAPPPVAAFSGTPLTGEAPLLVTFTDASTNTPTSWVWDFGDGGTSTSQNPSHTYTVAGTYTVELDATNAAGTDNEAKVGYVVVSEPNIIQGFSVAFDDAPMEADPTWTRVDTLTGCHVQEWTIDRGRPTEFDKTDTGTAVVRIIDREGLFDPTNTSSPYNGLILPGRQAGIALMNPVSDEWFTLFRGFIESWHYRLDQTRQYMELEIQLVDGFAILARAILEVGEDGALPLPDEIADGFVGYGETLGTVKDRIDGILGDVDWPVALRDVFTGNVRVGPKAYGPGTSALDAIWDAVDAEFPGVANCWMSKEGLFVFRGRQARFRPEVAEYQINERTVGDPSGWELDPDVVPVSELEWSNGQDNLFNAVSATPQGVGSGTGWRQLDPELDDIPGQYVTDPTSITAYGLRSLTFDQLQTIEGIATSANSMVETKKFATYYVENYATPESRITRMVFKSRRPGNTNGTALWNHLCRIEISDLLTVQTAHPGSGGFLGDKFYVEGIHYTCRPGPPTFPIVELSLDVSPQAHYTTNPFDEDTDPE